MGGPGLAGMPHFDHAGGCQHYPIHPIPHHCRPGGALRSISKSVTTTSQYGFQWKDIDYNHKYNPMINFIIWRGEE
jgi:hypothetical protein